jgi:AraC-like DNA-binding protein
VSITSTIVDQAEIRFREAVEALKPYVGCFWTITAGRHAAIRVVPDGSTSISAQQQDGRWTGWSLRGPLVRPDERRFTSPATLVGIRLRPGVAYILSGIAAHQTVGRRLELKEIAPFRELVTQSPTPQTPEQHIDALERFLIARLKDTGVHSVVAKALHEIEREHGCSKIKEVTRRCSVSPRHLNRLMHEWIGYGPKVYASIVRFQMTLKQIDRAPAQLGAALAYDTGYFDQAHLTSNLVRFAGETPRRLASDCAADFSKTRCDDTL